MLPVTPYRPGKYPPGPQWTQFGDDVLGHAMSNTSEEARQKLAAKREGMAQFHMDRLQRGGFAPVPRMQGAVHHTFADHNDPEEEYVDAYDRVERPANPSRSGYETPRNDSVPTCLSKRAGPTRTPSKHNGTTSQGDSSRLSNRSEQRACGCLKHGNCAPEQYRGSSPAG